MSLFVPNRTLKNCLPTEGNTCTTLFPLGPPCCSYAEERQSCGAKPTALFQKTELDTGASPPRTR